MVSKKTKKKIKLVGKSLKETFVSFGKGYSKIAPKFASYGQHLTQTTRYNVSSMLGRKPEPLMVKKSLIVRWRGNQVDLFPIDPLSPTTIPYLKEQLKKHDITLNVKSSPFEGKLIKVYSAPELYEKILLGRWTSGM